MGSCILVLVIIFAVFLLGLLTYPFWGFFTGYEPNVAFFSMWLIAFFMGVDKIDMPKCGIMEYED